MTTLKKGYKGMGMEGKVAHWYAKNTRKGMADFCDLGSRLARDLPARSRVLEVAPGPGFLAIELARLGDYEIVGLDISKTFVEMARENARAAGVTVDFRYGNASDMPLADGSFDLVICRAAFKNFSDPVGALDEMHRVLKPGGSTLIIDLRKDVNPRDLDTYIGQLGVGWFDALMMKFTFRAMLIPRAYSRVQFNEMAAQSKFGRCEISDSPIGFEITLRK